MQLRVHPFDVLQRDWFVQQLLVERQREPALQLVIVKDGDAQDPPHEMKVAEMFWIHGRIRIYLQRVVVVAAVLEQAVLGIEHFARQQMEPLARHPAVIQPLLAPELHHQPLAHVFRSHLHYKSVALLEHFASGHLQAAVAALRLHRRQFRPERPQFAHQVSPVLRQEFGIVQQALRKVGLVDPRPRGHRYGSGSAVHGRGRGGGR